MLTIICNCSINAAFAAKSNFLTLSSLSDKAAQTVLDSMDSDTIVFISIDDVLVTPLSAMFHYTSPYKWFINDLASISKQKPYYKKIIASWYQQRKLRLVDARWLEYILQMQRKGVKIYGLCTNVIDLTNLEEFRYFELSGLGVDFQKLGRGDKKDINLYQIKSVGDRRSVFYKSILFTGPFDKGQMIIDLFTKTKQKPSKLFVFMLDNNDIKQIEKHTRRYRMQFYGIEYLGIKNIESNIDINVIKLQQSNLIKSLKWIEDESMRMSPAQ